MMQGFVELRENGASLWLIRGLLVTVGVAISTATMARFLAEVRRSSTSARQHQRLRIRSEFNLLAFVSDRPRDDRQVGPIPG
jgi:hypothetical protein